MAKTNTAPADKATTQDDLDLPKTAVKPSAKEQYIKGLEDKLAEYNDEPKVEPNEEETFKKRYGDLRRFSQQKEGAAQRKIEELESQVKQLEKAASQPMPKNQEEFEAWKVKYPDITSFIETIADQKASQRSAQLQEELGTVKEKLNEAEKDKAKAYLKILVPDYIEIYSSQEFNEWTEEQPRAIKEILDTSEDPEDLAKVFNTFKKIKELSEAPRKAPRKDSKLDVLDVSVRNTGSTPSNAKNQWKYTQSQIQKMSTNEFVAKEEDIIAARNAGLILDDLSRKNSVFDMT